MARAAAPIFNGLRGRTSTIRQLAATGLMSKGLYQLYVSLPLG